MKRKRSKRSRLRGKRWCGHGSKYNVRGKGSKGGKGKAGTGKMAGHKKTYTLKHYDRYLGKKGFKSRSKKLEKINLNKIQEKIGYLIKKGLAKKSGNGFEIILENYKVLGSGNIGADHIIKANEFSKKALEKISASGSKAEKIR